MVILRAEPQRRRLDRRGRRRSASWAAALGAATLGVELGTFAGALAVGAREQRSTSAWRRRPAAVVLVPGILLLVPGSVGFRSLSSLLEREAVAGIETAFSMLLTAMALVAGLLVAGVIAPEPRMRDSPK